MRGLPVFPLALEVAALVALSGYTVERQEVSKVTIDHDLKKESRYIPEAALGIVKENQR